MVGGFVVITVGDLEAVQTSYLIGRVCGMCGLVVGKEDIIDIAFNVHIVSHYFHCLEWWVGF